MDTRAWFRKWQSFAQRISGGILERMGTIGMLAGIYLVVLACGWILEDVEAVRRSGRALAMIERASDVSVSAFGLYIGWAMLASAFRRPGAHGGPADGGSE